jgi:hypothetical protein
MAGSLTPVNAQNGQYYKKRVARALQAVISDSRRSTSDQRLTTKQDLTRERKRGRLGLLLCDMIACQRRER